MAAIEAPGMIARIPLIGKLSSAPFPFQSYSVFGHVSYVECGQAFGNPLFDLPRERLSDLANCLVRPPFGYGAGYRRAVIRFRLLDCAIHRYSGKSCFENSLVQRTLQDALAGKRTATPRKGLLNIRSQALQRLELLPEQEADKI
jgi:hypothetical protein